MNRQTWSYYLPEDSGYYFWQPDENQEPMLVYWDNLTTMALGCLSGLQYYPLSGRWSVLACPDPYSPWYRQPGDQLEITNSTTEPIQVRVSPIDDCILESEWVDKHPEVLEGLNDLDDTSN